MKDLSRRAVIAALSSACVAASFAPAVSQEQPRVALRGFDPVAYFTEGKPQQGSPQFSATYDDATYHFKNAEHRALFVANPAKYAPQFQGFCTIDLSRGIKTEADPQAWSISEGKLYVFGKPRGPGLFAEDGPTFVSKARENWAVLGRSR